MTTRRAFFINVVSDDKNQERNAVSSRVQRGHVQNREMRARSAPVVMMHDQAKRERTRPNVSTGHGYGWSFLAVIVLAVSFGITMRR